MKMKVLQLRIDPETRKDLELAAQDQFQSLSEFIAQQLQEWASDRQK